MIGMKKLVNRAAVREAFHRQGARVPRGFMEEVEQAVYVLLRRAAAKEIEPGDDAAEAPAETYLKESPLKEALREALGKSRVEAAWTARLNALITAKVTEASVRTGAKAGNGPAILGVPGRVLRTFLRSPEAKRTTFSEFHRRWQDEEFRQEWAKRAKYKVKKGSS